MGLSDKNFEKIRALAQGQVAEPVLAAAIFLPRGETGARAAIGFAPGAGLGMHADARQRAPQFPKESLLAVTETALYAWKVKGGFSWKVQEPIGQWPFGSFAALAEDGKITKALILDWGGGEVAQLETQTSGANSRMGEIVDLLTSRSGPPA